MGPAFGCMVPRKALVMKGSLLLLDGPSVSHDGVLESLDRGGQNIWYPEFWRRKQDTRVRERAENDWIDIGSLKSARRSG